MQTILIINNAEPGIQEYTEPLIKIIKNCNAHSVTLEYKYCKDFDFEKSDGIIMTGSPQGDDIVEHHLPYFQWIKDINKPVLGICAGHHITGFLYGAELLRNKEPESGDFSVEIFRPDLIFQGMDKHFRVKQMHNDSITLPDEFELLATSKTCYNQLMKHKNRPFYTSQFHPEYYNHRLIENFVSLCR